MKDIKFTAVSNSQLFSAVKRIEKELAEITMSPLVHQTQHVFAVHISRITVADVKVVFSEYHLSSYPNLFYVTFRQSR